MAEPLSAQLRRPVPLALLVAAVIGWLLFLIAIASRSTAVGEYEAQLTDLSTERDTVASRLVALEEATGTLEQQQAVIVAGQTELADLQTQIAQLTQERQAALAQTEEARNQFQTAQAELAALEQTLAAATQERDAALGTLEEARAELTSIEERVVARTQDLAEIGERVEQARASEAELLETVAELTDTNASLAQESAQTEEALQALREEEAQLTASREQTEDALAALQTQAEELQTLVAALEQRREEVATDVTEAETRRGELQASVTELANSLASRGGELAELEQRIAEAQERNAALLLPSADVGETTGTGDSANVGASAVLADPQANGAQSETPVAGDTTQDVASAQSASAASDTSANAVASTGEGFSPGAYSTGTINALFGEDGTFQMTTDRGRRVIGRYEASGDRLTLTEATGSIGRTRFPMECQLSGDGAGFTLGAVEESCRLFDGLTFELAQ